MNSRPGQLDPEGPGEDARLAVDRHIPRIDDVDEPLAVRRRRDVAVSGPPEAEVRDPVVLSAAPPDIPVAGQRLQRAAGRVCGDLEQEPDPLGRISDQRTALGPPQLLALIEVGLAMSDVPAAYGAFPAPAHEFLAAYIAPALIKISFVAAFVDDDGLGVFLPPFAGVLRRAVRVNPLDAAVSDPRAGVIVEAVAVMDRGEVAHVIVRAYDHGQPFPVLGRLRRQQIVLIGHRPPDGAVSAQPPDEVLDIPVVSRFCHRGESPAVVRVKQDQVGLDS